MPLNRLDLSSNFRTKPRRKGSGPRPEVVSLSTSSSVHCATNLLLAAFSRFSALRKSMNPMNEVMTRESVTKKGIT